MAASTQTVTEAIEPYHEQEPFLWDSHRYYGFISGVGAGKTATGVMRTVVNAEIWNRGEMGAIVAPSTRMIKNAIFPVMHEFGIRDRWDFTGFQAEEPGFHTPDGGRIVILSADNERTVERLANLNLAYWWLDEAKETPKRARDVLRERLRKGDYRNGYITTTPNGYDHNYDFFVGEPEEDGELTKTQWGAATMYEGYGDRLCVAHVPSWANPHNPDDFKEEMKNLPEDIRRQQAEGHFVERKGLVYPWFDPEEHCIGEVEANVRRVFYGLDWGKVNPFSILAIGETTRDELVVLDMEYETGLDYQEQVKLAMSMQDRHGPGPIYCDSAEPAAIDMLKKSGLNAQKSVKDLLPGIQYVSAQCERLHVVMPECESLLHEFNAYHYPDDEESEKPVDADNHALDALRYALMTDSGGASIGMAGMADPL